MIASRGTTLVQLDQHASEAEKPYGIITVDCSNPYEYDDGIAVTPLPLAEDVYRVSVFAVDASRLYQEEDVIKHAIDRTEAFYNTPKTGPKTYIPMIDTDIIRSTEFSQGNIRDALVVSFLIGKNVLPSEVKIEFGRVEVRKNFAYHRFGNRCRYDQDYELYGRAAAFILDHLSLEDFDEERKVEERQDATYDSLIYVSSSEKWKRGANINEAFMVAANYLVGRELANDGNLAIYRRHDPDDERLTEIFGPQMAHYSTVPGPHKGIGVDAYSRVTSPLRRVEDLVMHGLLQARATGRELGIRDRRIVDGTIQRLNQRIAAELYEEKPRLQPGDIWGKRRPHLQSVAS